jgi:hypothetical protein
MAQVGNVLYGAIVMAAVWTLIGGPVAARIAPHLPFWGLAPMLGWAIHSVVALPLHCAIGLSQPSALATITLLLLAAAAALGRLGSDAKIERVAAALTIAVMAAGALALVPLAAILPTAFPDGIALSEPIYDHSKIALTAEMMRSGVPAANPFFSDIGAPERVSYHYLWHFSAAAMATAMGISGWEADAALTWFTAFASLLVVITFAVWIGGRNSAALFAVAIAATGSARSVVEWLLGNETAYAALGWATGFGGWLFQVSWAPQHVAGATCVVIAGYVLTRMQERRDPVLIIVLALLAAASFESSAWAGMVFVIAASAMTLLIVRALPVGERLSFLVSIALAGILAAALASLFVYDQLTTVAVRDAGSPITFGAVSVLGDAFPVKLRGLLDLPAYWLVYLPLELPASYPAGMALAFVLASSAGMSAEDARITNGFILLLAISLVIAWLLVSDLGGNNDLSWRGALPAILLLTIFAAAGLARWTAEGKLPPLTLAAAAIALGTPNGVELVIRTASAPAAAALIPADTLRMWSAVRRHAEPQERVANNPLFLADATAWPVNISWALLADRRSCYAGHDLAIAFAPVSATQRKEIDALFARVFSGHPVDGDVEKLATRHHCDVVVTTPQDGAWSRDPFAASGLYRMVEAQPQAWRIYRKSAAQKPKR